MKHHAATLSAVAPPLVPRVHAFSCCGEAKTRMAGDIRAFTPVFDGLCPAMTIDKED